ncbi:MAG: EAL domain-containing protein [Alphaproteobacteria bacterium]|nr:EAL domain-containing protein [Alphaproteobacteria bacterium]
MSMTAAEPAVPFDVLVVDDDKSLCLELVSALRRYQIPARGMGDIRDLGPGFTGENTVIVLDLAMPFDGFRTIDYLAERPFLPGIILSSGESARIIAAAAEYSKRTGNEVLGSLEKPYDVGQLIAMLRAVEPGAIGGRRRDARPPRQAMTESEQLRVVFQGKFDLQAEGPPALVAFEALSRTPDGASAEHLFAPDADAARQERLTMQVLDQCKAFADQLAAHGVLRPIAINVTPGQFANAGFMLRFADRIDSLGLPRGTISVELTENSARADTVPFAATASQLAMRGIAVALDDFGTGNCGLEWLVDVPAAELKIDKTIFWHFCSGRMPRLILDSVIAHCQTAGIHVTIEGVETEQQLAFARSAGARFVQGYHFGTPSAPSAWLDRLTGSPSTAA